jgi:hypothetical protein
VLAFAEFFRAPKGGNNMRSNRLFLVVGVAVVGILLALPAAGAEWIGSAVAGYNSGPGGTASLTASNLVEALPITVRLGVGYTAVEPGSPADARRIFINDATNGTPEERGWRWDYRFDVSYPVSIGALQDFAVHVGVRYCRHTSNFNFIGGNEDFDVTSNQWGWGVGLDKLLRMSSKTDFVLTTGVDYYLSGKLQGHDTSYQNGGEDVNPRLDFTYADADAAINQPSFEFRFMLGINYRFGQ